MTKQEQEVTDIAFDILNKNSDDFKYSSLNGGSVRGRMSRITLHESSIMVHGVYINLNGAYTNIAKNMLDKFQVLQQARDCSERSKALDNVLEKLKNG